MKKFIEYAVASVLLTLTSCGSIKNINLPGRIVNIPLIEYIGTPSSNFNNADKPIKVRAKFTQNLEEEITQKGNHMLALGPRYTFTPEVGVFAKSATENYMDAQGFELSNSADYVLEINVRTLEFSKADRQNTNYQVSLSYSVLNEAGEMVVPTNSSNGYVTLESFVDTGEGLGRAYFEALQKINWQRIAKLLTVRKLPKEEKNRAVSGNGDTALEHTVIRWNIVSRPQGADVSWRVISSTPDVQNTNSNYVGSTPYESTESFDIKGLTYNNSGNVQIEVTCERAGYLPQKKRFNLRQAIDQKEISAMFNLVKDE